MQLNKEKSRKMIRLLSLSLASSLMISGGRKTIADEPNEIIRKQIEYHSRQQQMLEMIKKLPKDDYDEKYNNYCEEDIITIKDKEYAIRDLYIEYGYIGEEKIVYLIDYHNPKIDVITGKIVDSKYERKKIMLLKYSDVFYSYYCNNDKEIGEYINYFEGGINYNVPETYFYNPELENKERMK